MRKYLIPKVKEPVRLRYRQLRCGSLSLYLDSYHHGKHHYEFLHLYLVPERSVADRKVNRVTLHTAIQIKSERIIALISQKSDNHPTSTIRFSDLIRSMITERQGRLSESSLRSLRRLAGHLECYKAGASVEDADRTFCVGFADYLRTARALNNAAGRARKLSPTTQAELLSSLSRVMNEAVRRGYITQNPVRLLTISERIRKSDSAREFLIPEEIDKLAELKLTGNEQEVRDAFIFSCFSGLRWSDIVRLKWDNIESNRLRIYMQKTGNELTIPLSQNALRILDLRKRRYGVLIFQLPKYGKMCRILRRLAERAGVEKRVTFHVSRHTFATLLLTAGADLYVTSKLLGHKDVKVTQIYAKVIDKRKEDALSNLDKFWKRRLRASPCSGTETTRKQKQTK